MEKAHMQELQSVTALESLVSQIAGKHESAEVKADLALAGTAVGLLAQTLVPRLDPVLDLAGFDAALSDIFSGITKLALLTASTSSTAQPTLSATEATATQPTA